MQSEEIIKNIYSVLCNTGSLELTSTNGPIIIAVETTAGGTATSKPHLLPYNLDKSIRVQVTITNIGEKRFDTTRISNYLPTGMSLVGVETGFEKSGNVLTWYHSSRSEMNPLKAIDGLIKAISTWIVKCIIVPCQPSISYA